MNAIVTNDDGIEKSDEQTTLDDFERGEYEPDCSEEIQAMYAPYSVEAGIGLPPEDY